MAILSDIKYILGRQLRNETEAIKPKVIKLGVEEGSPRELKSRNGRLIVSYSQKRARNDRKKPGKRIETIGKETPNWVTDQRSHQQSRIPFLNFLKSSRGYIGTGDAVAV
ncbi:hypothetical protein SAMN05444280_10811 [Tangfeifania diversioriginum]|uniref:Uncharacterized protein n=1 Tax=Tangfeifania diversioriginum TaxID=1168035 RepID=A0A1M6F2K3_9BACT|nr:hypothetical protein SAMN05444280_10811 [Tangfeifania diversioriginum]